MLNGKPALVNEFRTGKRYNFGFDAMKYEIPIRIRVLRPLGGVTMRVQRGRDELLAPSEASPDALVFDFGVSVDISDAIPNFLGKYAQGPKGERFIYVNSGKYAGQKDALWARRAKISLMSITREQIETVLKKRGAFLETAFAGTGGRDGGPTCASVKGTRWRIARP